MNYENYTQLQESYLSMFQNNSEFHDFTEAKQFKFINKCLRKRYKSDYKKLVKYERMKDRKINKIFRRNKKKFKVVSNKLAIEMFENEQKSVSKLNREFEKVNFDNKRTRLLSKLKIGSKTVSKRTVQGISSSLNENGAKKRVSCNLHEADVIEQSADEE